MRTPEGERHESGQGALERKKAMNAMSQEVDAVSVRDLRPRDLGAVVDLDEKVTRITRLANTLHIEDPSK